MDTSRLLSIGTLSQIIAIPVETLRTWERRYGWPAPERLASGHRRYRAETVERLLLVQQAVARGLRPSRAVPASEEELWRWLGGTLAARTGEADAATTVPHWLDAAARMDARTLESEMRRAWQAHGARAFVEQLAAPFLRELGRRWSRGDCGVADEHLATDVLRGFLAGQRALLGESAHGPAIVCATPAGERHDLGIALAGVLLVLAGLRVISLGADVPAAEIAAAARTSGAVGVVLGLSPAAPPALVRREVGELRAALAPEVELVLGGAQLPVPDAGVLCLASFDELSAWAEVKAGAGALSRRVPRASKAS